MRAKLHLGTEGVLAQVALGSPGRFAAFDDLVTLTVRAADRDESHGPFLPDGGYEDEAQCDSNLSPSPLLKHYPFSIAFKRSCASRTTREPKTPESNKSARVLVTSRVSLD